jgi:hypothetical protein
MRAGGLTQIRGELTLTLTANVDVKAEFPKYPGVLKRA